MLNQVTKLNLKVDIEELRDYYKTVSTDFQHLCWRPDVNTNMGVGNHRVEKLHGWGIESNSVDLTRPCSPYNIGEEKLDHYRDTELVFGIIHKFKKLFPFAHGYSLSVHPPGTYINFHIDSTEFIKIHVPIYSCENSWFSYHTQNYNLEADGSLYLVDTTVEHGTDNQGSNDRVHLIFKIPYDYYPIVLAMQGEL
jgi:hypothetical protein